MKSLKKLLAVLVVVTLMAGMIAVPAFAASFNYEDEAKVLYDLGLFKGKSETEYKPALEDRLLREEGVALLLRLFKLEEEALKMDEKEAKDLLNQKFKDADEIAAWAVKYVAYAVKNEIVVGRPDGKFAPKDNLIGREFAKMVLAQLGYKQDVDFDYKFSIVELANATGLSMSEASRMDEAVLLRDDVVGMSFYSLLAEYVAGANAGKTVIEVVVGNDESLKAIAIEAGLMEEPVIVEVAAIPDIEINVGDALNLPAKVKATYSDGKEAEVAVKWPQVDTSKAMAKTEITGTIEGTDVVAKVNVTIKEVVLKVDSVTADNLIEVVVTYNQDVSGNDAVANKDNYKLNIGKTISSVSVTGNTAVLKLSAKANNQSKAKLTVSDKILGASADYEFTFFDGTLPDVLDLVVVGPKRVEVTFSEPIEQPSATDLNNLKITVKTGNSTISANKGGITGWGTRTLSIPLYSSFVEDKEYNVTLENFADYAGYKNIIRTFTFAYVKDTTAPVATIDEVKQEYVKVSFNKPVTGLTTGHFSHTFTAWTAMKITTGDTFTSTVVNSGDSVKTVYVWFYNDGSTPSSERPIAEGETSFTILTKANNSEIKDEWGNKFAETTYTISVAADKTAPEVKEVKVTGEQTFTVEFTKNVAGFTASDNLEVLNADGTSITGLNITVTAESAKKFTVNLGKNMAGKSILVNIKNVKDNTLNANKLTLYTVTLDITDKTSPKVNKVSYEAVGASTSDTSDDAWYLYVFFNEDVEPDTALNANNYYIKNSTTYTKLTETAEFFAGNKIVKIKLTSTQKGLIQLGTTELFVTNVKDIAGNEIEIVADLPKIIAINASTNAPYIEKAEATAVNTIQVTFNEELATYDLSAFKVLRNGADYASVTSLDPVVADGKTKLIMAIDTNLPYNPEDTGDTYAVKIIDTNAITNLINVNPATNEVEVVKDKIAPALVDTNPITATAGGKIAIKFTEAIDENLKAYIPWDLVITKVSDGSVLEPATAYTANVNGDTVEITITGLSADTKFKVASKESITYIRDVKGNKAKAFTSAKEITADMTAPTLVSTTLSTDKKTVTMVFSEAVANALADLDALKSAIKLSTDDGTNFAILGANDTVAITNGNLVITFENPLSGATNKIRIAAGALKDALGNATTADIITGQISAN